MKWLVLALLWGVALLNYLDRQVIFSVFPLLKRDLHATDFELGLISTVFLVTYGLMSAFSGYVADRIGKVRVILFSLAIWTLATWTTGKAANISQLLASRAVMGISEAFYLPAALALISDWHAGSTRSLATGLHQSGLYTGIVLGGVWGGWMGDTSGWRPIFSILGILGALYIIPLFFVLKDRAETSPVAATFATSVRSLFGSSPFRSLAIAFTAMSVANWLINTWLPMFLYERLHVNMASAGFSATFYIQAAGYVGVILGGIVADRWSMINRSARVMVAVLGLSLAAPFLLSLTLTHSYGLLVFALIAFGLSRGIFDCNIMPIVRQIAPAHLSATAYGLLNLLSCVTGGIGAGLAGWFKQILGLEFAFRLAAVVLILGAATLLLGRTRMAVAAAFLCFAMPFPSINAAEKEHIVWRELPDLPRAVGGQFVGVVDDTLVVAGGSYFETPPWDGGKKFWVDKVYTLRRGATAWKLAGHLPAPLGYGVSISHEHAMLLIGGQDGKTTSTDVLQLTLTGEQCSIRKLTWSLPQPLSMLAGANIGEDIWVAGGQIAATSVQASSEFLHLAIGQWQETKTWPGTPRILPLVATLEQSIYLISGAELTGQPGPPLGRKFLTDAYRFTPGSGWEALPPLEHPVQAGLAIGWNGRVLIFGGNDGTLADREFELKENHPGFSKDVLAFDPQKRAWSKIGSMPYSLVTTGVVKWGNEWVIAGGEARPAHRSAKVIAGHFRN